MKRSWPSGVKLAVSMIALLALAASFDRIPQSSAVRRQMWGLNQANFHEFREMLSARKLPELDARFSFANRGTDAGVVRASFAGGIRGDTLFVELNGSETIFYTLDGSIPTKRSDIYKDPVPLNASTVIRARHLPSNSAPGAISTWHHIHPDNYSLAVVSLAMDPVDLWNKYVGLYANPFGRGREWERSAHVAYQQAETGTVTSFEAEARIHGGYSRYSEKKSFRLRYSTDSIRSLLDDLFTSTTVDGENTIILRTTIDPTTQVRDALATALYADLGYAVSQGQPVELLLNGKYWGLYHLRERVADGFLSKHFGSGEYEFLKHDSERPTVWLTPEIGTRNGWDSTIVRLAGVDMTTDDGAALARELFDVDGMIDYWIHNIITGNIDWPYNNTHVFRRLDGDDRRWRWLAWDLDPAFNFIQHNTLAWALRDTVRNDLKWNFRAGVMEDQPHQVVSTMPMRLILQNPDIRDRFVARTQVLLELHYTESSTRRHLQSILNSQSSAFMRDAQRWGWKLDSVAEQIELIERFVRERPQHVRAHLASYFGLGEPVTVRIENPHGEAASVERYLLPPGVTHLTLLRGTRLNLAERGSVGAGNSRTLVIESDTTLQIR